MTREELYREIKRIDAFIDVLQVFLTKPLCKCITLSNNVNDHFTEENKKHLRSLINIRNFLLPLKGEPDNFLAEVAYKPVAFPC